MNDKPLVKICGLRDEKNILEVAELCPEMMGFIFYGGSKRFVGQDFKMPPVPASVKKIGVFVDAGMCEIFRAIDKYSLDMVQLHGTEPVSFCYEVNKRLPVIKAFGLDSSSSLHDVDEFMASVSYFLFDTRTNEYGGSGKKFDWEVLDGYNGDIPFFLSGGIGHNDVPGIMELMKRNKKLAAVDVSSRFEIEPGLKDVEQLKTFIHEIRS